MTVQCQRLSAVRKPGLSNTQKQYSMELLAMANVFDKKKYSPQQRLRFAKRLMASLLKTSYKDWNELKPQSKELAAALVKQSETNSGPWLPEIQNKNYTSAPVNPTAKDKVNPQSSVSYSDCVARKKASGYPAAGGQAELECSQEISSIRNQSLNNPTPSNNFQNPSNTAQYFGGKGKSSLEKAKETLVRAAILEENIRANKASMLRAGALLESVKRQDSNLKSGSTDPSLAIAPAWVRARAFARGEYTPPTSNLKSGSTESSNTWIAARQYQFDDSYRNQVNTKSEERRIKNAQKRLKSGSNNNPVPAWIRARQASMAKFGNTFT